MISLHKSKYSGAIREFIRFICPIPSLAISLSSKIWVRISSNFVCFTTTCVIQSVSFPTISILVYLSEPRWLINYNFISLKNFLNTLSALCFNLSHIIRRWLSSNSIELCQSRRSQQHYLNSICQTYMNIIQAISMHVIAIFIILIKSTKYLPQHFGEARQKSSLRGD